MLNYKAYGEERRRWRAENSQISYTKTMSVIYHLSLPFSLTHPLSREVILLLVSQTTYSYNDTVTLKGAAELTDYLIYG